MNVNDIYNRVKLHTRIDASIVDVRNKINDCMSELGNMYDTACKLNTTNIKCTDAYSSYELPENVGIARVENSNGTNYKDFKIILDKIKFGYEDEFTVYYYTINKLEDKEIYDTDYKTEKLPINTAYHNAISYYVASEILKNIDIQNPKIQLLETKFYKLADEANKRLKNKKKTNIYIPAPAWR